MPGRVWLWWLKWESLQTVCLEALNRRSVFRYPTQPEIKRFEVRTSQLILSETPPSHDMDRCPGSRRGNVHTLRRMLPQFDVRVPGCPVWWLKWETPQHVCVGGSRPF
jgi:hypothetical protein